MEDNSEFPKMPVEVPDFLKGDEWFGVDVEPTRLDFREVYKPPKYTLSWNGTPFAPIGGIHNITGQAGNGKTMAIAQFMAAILCGRVGSLRYELSEERPHPKVLYVDTEMEKDNTIAVKNRVLTMAGRDIGKEYDDFVVIMLREVSDGKRVTKDKRGNDVVQTVPASVIRWRMVLKAIWQYQPDVCFIDGLIDVIADFNDNVMCQEIIYKCMQTATHYNISLWCILHQNPGGEKLVGHLGSFLERKVTDIFEVKKEKNDKTGEVLFRVKQKKARSQDVDEWKFKVLPVNSWGMPEQIDQQNERLGAYTVDDVKRWLQTYAMECTWPATLSDIRFKIFKAKCNVTNNDELQKCVTMATNRRFIVPQPESEFEDGQRHPRYYLNQEELGDVPF